MEKALKDITRTEWIKYQWIDVTQMGDEERIMLQGFLRTPDEMMMAIEEWDISAEALTGV
jgi:predicted RecB family nuclease